ncbi:MAG: phospholipase [Acidimicrobiales bacterium]|nr:phospholipase [Acidimicrobiales bacterium]RZV44073.1 MAG: phospholipase [Acidimicrobiales bacterium]
MTDPNQRTRDTRVGPDLATASVVVIGLHGRDQGPDMIEEAVVNLTADPTVAWLLPFAAGGSWYPHPFDDPSEENEAAVERSVVRLNNLVDSIGIARRHVVIIGFSQGACLACEFVARNPTRWGGLVAFTGGLMGPAGTHREIADELHGTPVVLSAGELDPWIAPDAVRSSGLTFERAGAAVTTEVIPADADHRIRPREIDQLRRVINAARRPGDGGNT